RGRPDDAVLLASVCRRGRGERGSSSGWGAQRAWYSRGAVSPNRTGTPAANQVDAEQEVDFSRYWWAIVARWWLVVLCVAIGVGIGYPVSLGGGAPSQARTTVYLGQPLTATGSGALQGVATNPTTVN